MNKEYNRRLVEKAQRAGVTIIDPDTTWLHDTVDLAPDVTILPGTSLEGATSVASGATIGPDTTLVDVEVGEGATVIRTHGVLASSAPGRPSARSPTCVRAPSWGPAARSARSSRPRTPRSGPGAKVPHLTYAGDAEIG